MNPIGVTLKYTWALLCKIVYHWQNRAAEMLDVNLSIFGGGVNEQLQRN